MLGHVCTYLDGIHQKWWSCWCPWHYEILESQPSPFGRLKWEFSGTVSVWALCHTVVLSRQIWGQISFLFYKQYSSSGTWSEHVSSYWDFWLLQQAGFSCFLHQGAVEDLALFEWAGMCYQNTVVTHTFMPSYIFFPNRGHNRKMLVFNQWVNSRRH